MTLNVIDTVAGNDTPFQGEGSNVSSRISNQGDKIFNIHFGNEAVFLDGVSSYSYTRSTALFDKTAMRRVEAGVIATNSNGSLEGVATRNVVPDASDLTAWTNSGTTITPNDGDIGGENLDRLQIANGSGATISIVCAAPDGIKVYVYNPLIGNPNSSTGIIHVSSSDGLTTLDMDIDLAQVGVTSEVIDADHAAVTVTAALFSHASNPFTLILSESGSSDVDCQIGCQTSYVESATDREGESVVIPTSGSAVTTDLGELDLVLNARGQTTLNAHLFYAEFTVTQDTLGVSTGNNGYVFEAIDDSSTEGLSLFLNRAGADSWTVVFYKRLASTTYLINMLTGITDANILGAHKVAVGINSTDGIRGSYDGNTVEGNATNKLDFGMDAQASVGVDARTHTQHGYMNNKHIYVEGNALTGASLDTFLVALATS